MRSFKDKVTDGLKRELGIVYYGNYKVIFRKGDPMLAPYGTQDTGDEWTWYVPFVKPLGRFIIADFIKSIPLGPEFKKATTLIDIADNLLNKQQAEAKDHISGRWIQLWITKDKHVEKYWPPENKIIHQSSNK